jgi:guanylate kinase
MQIKRQGIVFALSAPSGAGKTTIARDLLNREIPNMHFSISATTRPIRQGEIDGLDYNFVTKEKFEDMIINQELLECAEIHGKYYYGTPKKPVRDAITNGEDIIMTIDIQGVKSLREIPWIQGNLVTIFIIPPSFKEIEKRLLKRGRETKEQIKNRLKTAEEEIKNLYNYDYIILNDQIIKASRSIENIIYAERLKRVRIGNLKEVVKKIKE